MARGDVTLHLDEIRTTTEKKKALRFNSISEKNVKAIVFITYKLDIIVLFAV